MAPKQVIAKSDESLQVTGQAILNVLQATLEALKEDQASRNGLREYAETAVNLATTATANIANLEKRVDALMGDGSGDNGQIASMQKTIRQTEKDMQEVKSDMKTVLSTMSKLETNTDKSKDFMAGWRGVFVALSVAATGLAVVGGIIAVVVKLYH